MSYPTSEQDDTFIPIFDMIPDNWEEARIFLNEQLRRISNAINAREIGYFVNEQTINGQQFIPTIANPTVLRTIFRKVINFGALPNAGTKSVPHGLTVNSSFQLLNMYLAASDPVGLTGFSLQYWQSAGGSDIILSYNSTNVIVQTNSNYSNFTLCVVVMEYIQQQ